MADLCRCHQRPLVNGKCSRPRGTGPAPIVYADAAARPTRGVWRISPELRARFWAWGRSHGVEGYNGIPTAESVLRALFETLEAYEGSD